MQTYCFYDIGLICSPKAKVIITCSSIVAAADLLGLDANRLNNHHYLVSPSQIEFHRSVDTPNMPLYQQDAFSDYDLSDANIAKNFFSIRQLRRYAA
ncbi:hypothetical protein AB4254_08640 [Vibrio breoganii]